jgi:hypothetical protein
MKYHSILLLTLVIGFFSCTKEPEDKTQTINKDGAIETVIGVEHLDATHDILTTKHITWVGGTMTKTIEHIDTIASLGMKKEEAVNDQDESMVVTIPKDYEIYITVK